MADMVDLLTVVRGDPRTTPESRRIAYAALHEYIVNGDGPNKAEFTSEDDARGYIVAQRIIEPALAVIGAARDGHGVCSCAAMTDGEGPRPIGDGRYYHYQGCDFDDGLGRALAAFDAAVEEATR